MKRLILNLTQHEASAEQKRAGVVAPADKNLVKSLLDFAELPSPAELLKRAIKLVDIIEAEIAFINATNSDYHCDQVMIGGAPFFMSTLEYYIKRAGFSPVYAFSKRESIDEVQPDGSIKKVSVFNHAGFVEVL